MNDALDRWTGYYCAAWVWLVFAFILLGFALQQTKFAATLLSAVMVLVSLLGLVRMKQVWPKRVQKLSYSDWRKAAQKPFEAVGGVLLLCILALLAVLFNGGRLSELGPAGPALLGLLAWVPLPWLLGTAGADIAAWRTAQAKAGSPLMASQEGWWRRNLLFLILVPLAAGVCAAIASDDPGNPLPPPVACTLQAGTINYSCAPQGTWHPTAPPTSQPTLAWPTYTCSAPPATRGPQGNFPAHAASYACTGRP